MKEIKLTKGFVALVDDEDFERVNQFKWTALVSKKRDCVYAYRKKYGNGGSITILMHRYILGIDDETLEVDHVDLNGINNCRKNLRVCTHAQNNQNKKAHKDSTSKFIGVSWYKTRSKWRSTIFVEGKQKSLGYHESEHSAATAYNSAAMLYFGEFANLNRV